MDDIMPGSDGPENLRILKNESVESWIWAVEDVVGFFGSPPTGCAACL